MRLFLYLVTAFLVLSAAGKVSAENFYSVGVVPQYETSKLHKIWRPILSYLEQETGERFELRGSNSIEEFETQFAKGEFDFSYMNPLHLVVANEKAGYIPLIRDISKKLYGVLVVRKDSNINSIADLHNSKIAFPAPNALGASLMIRKELKDHFGIDFQPVYVKSHDSVYLNVMVGVTQAGGGVQKTFNSQSPEVKNSLRILHTTAKVNPHPFSALPTVPAELRDKVTKALIKLGQTEQGRQMLSRVPIGQAGVAKIDDYLPLKALQLDALYHH